MIRIEIRTTDELPIPWPDTEMPPALRDELFWEGDLYVVQGIRWLITEGVCQVTAGKLKPYDYSWKQKGSGL